MLRNRCQMQNTLYIFVYFLLCFGCLVSFFSSFSVDLSVLILRCSLSCFLGGIFERQKEHVLGWVERRGGHGRSW